MTAMPNEPSTPVILRDIYDRLFRAYGPQHWWPAETPTEVVIGAILAQNTAWANAERAIALVNSTSPCMAAIDTVTFFGQSSVIGSSKAV